jgi:hypothetical protein
MRVDESCACFRVKTYQRHLNARAAMALLRSNPRRQSSTWRSKQHKEAIERLEADLGRVLSAALMPSEYVEVLRTVQEYA